MASVLIFNYGGKGKVFRHAGGDGIQCEQAQGWSDLSGRLRSNVSFDLVILDAVPSEIRPQLTRRIKKIKDVPVIFFEQPGPGRGAGRPAAREIKKKPGSLARSEQGRELDSRQAMELARRFMDDHFKQPLTLSEVSRQAGISPSYFCRRFKAHIGVSPIGYLKSLRIAHARYLLEHTNLPLAEVTEQSGFYSIPYFCREFRKASAISPIKYRTQCLASRK